MKDGILNNAEFLNQTVSSSLRFIEEKTNPQSKMKDSDEGTAIYLNLDLDNSTSPSAIYKTMLTGNLPGLIEIPKEMYFNNSKGEDDKE